MCDFEVLAEKLEREAEEGLVLEKVRIRLEERKMCW